MRKNKKIVFTGVCTFFFPPYQAFTRFISANYTHAIVFDSFARVLLNIFICETITTPGLRQRFGKTKTIVMGLRCEFNADRRTRVHPRPFSQNEQNGTRGQNARVQRDRIGNIYFSYFGRSKDEHADRTACRSYRS